MLEQLQLRLLESEQSQEPLDFEDPFLEIPACIFCKERFSNVQERKKPYTLPCQAHFSCKQCLSSARQRRADLRCPEDDVPVDLKLLKTLPKDGTLLRFTHLYEAYLRDLALEHGLAGADDWLDQAERIRQARLLRRLEAMQ